MASVELVGRLLVSLAVVLGLMWVVARKVRKGGGPRGGRNGSLIEVLDRASLSRSAAVAVVRVNDEAFVLGVAEQGVTILGSTDLGSALAARQSTTPARGHRRSATTRRTLPVGTDTATVPTVPTVPAAAPSVPTLTKTVLSSTAQPAAAAPGQRPGALNGSALSPQTWRQTVESLRDLTTRS